MSTQHHPRTPAVLLSDVMWPVEVVLDPTATRTTVETENLEDDDLNVTTSRGNLRIEGASRRGSSVTTITRTSRGGSTVTTVVQGGWTGTLRVDGDVVVTGGSISTASDGEVRVKESWVSRLVSLLLGRRHPQMTSREVVDGRVVLTVPACDLVVEECEDVTGRIDGRLSANVDGRGRLVVAGATSVDVEADSNAEVDLTAVSGDVRLDVDGAASVNVVGNLGETEVTAESNATVDVSGVGGNALLEVDGGATVTLGGTPRDVTVRADSRSTVEVQGVTGKVEVEADGGTDVSVSGTVGAVSVEADSLARVRVEGANGTGDLRVDADGGAKVVVVGDVNDVRIDADSRATVELTGTCQDGRVSADGGAHVRIVRALGTVRKDKRSSRARIDVG